MIFLISVNMVYLRLTVASSPQTNPLNLPKQSQILYCLSSMYLFAESGSQKAEQKVLMVRCLVHCAVRIFYRFVS